MKLNRILIIVMLSVLTLGSKLLLNNSEAQLLPVCHPSTGSVTINVGDPVCDLGNGSYWPPSVDANGDPYCGSGQNLTSVGTIMQACDVAANYPITFPATCNKCPNPKICKDNGIHVTNVQADASKCTVTKTHLCGCITDDPEA